MIDRILLPNIAGESIVVFALMFVVCLGRVVVRPGFAFYVIQRRVRYGRNTSHLFAEAPRSKS